MDYSLLKKLNLLIIGELVGNGLVQSCSKMTHQFNHGINKGKVVLVAIDGTCVRVHTKKFLETGFGQSYNRFTPIKLGTNVIQTSYKENILRIIFQKLYDISYVVPPLPLEDVIDLVFLIDEYLIDNFMVRSDVIIMLCQLITVHDFIEVYDEIHTTLHWMETFLEISCCEKISTDDFLILWKKYNSEVWFKSYMGRYFKYYLNQNVMDVTINELLNVFLREDNGYLSSRLDCLKFLLTCDIVEFYSSSMVHTVNELGRFLDEKYGEIIKSCKIVEGNKVYQILINHELTKLYLVIESHFECLPEGEYYKRAKKDFDSYLGY
jgi:hypothetical protein